MLVKLLSGVFVKLLFNIVLVFILLGCSSKKSVQPLFKQNGEPNSYNVITIKEFNKKSITVLATGENTTHKSSKDDSMRAAIWYSLYNSNYPVLVTKSNKKAFKQYKKRIYDSSLRYILAQSAIKAKKRKGNNILISIIYDVNVQLLISDLIKLNVLSADRAELYNASKPRVYLSKSNALSPHKDLEILSEILLKSIKTSGFELKKIKKIDKNLSSILNQTDIKVKSKKNKYLSGADIIISFDIQESKKSNEYSVQLSAKNNFENSEIANVNSLKVVKISLSKKEKVQLFTTLSTKFIKQINKNYTKQLISGRYYFLILNSEDKVLQKKIYNEIKSFCNISKNSKNKLYNTYILECKKDIGTELILVKLYNKFDKLQIDYMNENILILRK